MNKKVYNFLSKIPFVGFITRITVKPVIFCSPGLSEGVYDELFSYMRAHPNVLITEKLAKEIYSGFRK